MICPVCAGNGYVWNRTYPGDMQTVPCPECNCTGITSCCEGGIPCNEILSGDKIKRPGECANTSPSLTEANLNGGPHGSKTITRR